MSIEFVELFWNKLVPLCFFPKDFFPNPERICTKMFVVSGKDEIARYQIQLNNIFQKAEFQSRVENHSIYSFRFEGISFLIGFYDNEMFVGIEISHFIEQNLI